jgi:hypothetical protein
VAAPQRGLVGAPAHPAVRALAHEDRQEGAACAREHPALHRRDVVREEEAEGPEIAEAPDEPRADLRAVRLAAVLDHGEPAPARERHDLGIGQGFPSRCTGTIPRVLRVSAARRPPR